VTSKHLNSLDLNPELNKSLVLSSQEMGWQGISIEQFLNSPIPSEVEYPALSDHWLNLPMGHPVQLTQKRGDRQHKSIVQKGDSIFVPAGQPSYWRCGGSVTSQPTLHIHLKLELVAQVAETSELDIERVNLETCFSKQDLHLLHIATLLLAELESGGIMGKLYVESLTQVLVIHLLRHYSTTTPTITSDRRSLNYVQLQQAIDYIHTHLDRDLSLAEIAGVINISPTYFANLFKRATGISPHQYVIKQRVERAKELLLKTDLVIADIALRVGFSSQSHLNHQFKRLTGITPKQVR
jgi:AraC family transcriptional regulator